MSVWGYGSKIMKRKTVFPFKPPLCSHNPLRSLLQSLPLSGCSHGNHQVSRRAWKARWKAYDSLHMHRQNRHTSSLIYSNLPVHRVVTKRLLRLKACKQMTSLTVCHFITLWHTHTHTHGVIECIRRGGWCPAGAGRREKCVITAKHQVQFCCKSKRWSSWWEVWPEKRLRTEEDQL